MSFSRSRFAIVASMCGILVFFLSACNLPIQSDPPGQNSGSPQYAQGTFNLDDPHAVSGGVGQTLSVYDIYTTVTTSITVNSATISTTPANQNAASVAVLAPGEQFLVVNLTINNVTKGNTKDCPSGTCTEYISPLSNFRLIDPDSRNWPTSTGAAEACNPLSDACNSRRWVDEARNGIPAGGSFTATLGFVIPTAIHAFTLYYAAYRFNDTTTDTTAGGSSTGSATSTGTPASDTSTTTPTVTATATAGSPINRPTAAKIAINV